MDLCVLPQVPAVQRPCEEPAQPEPARQARTRAEEGKNIFDIFNLIYQFKLN